MGTLLLLLALAIGPRDLDGTSWGARRGETLVLDARFQGYCAGDVRVAKVPHGKLVLDEDSALAADLARFRIGAEPVDKKGRTNVRVTGTAVDIEGVGRALRVASVVKLPDDVTRFAERAKEAGADLLALAREARETAREIGEPGLAEWSRATFEAALDARRPRVTTAADALVLARDYRELAQVTSKAITVLGEHAADPAARAALSELGAVHHRDRWISSDELRLLLGQVRVNGRWVTALRAELEEEVAKQRVAAKERVFSLRTLPGAYEKLAAGRKLAAGMLKQEASVAKGLPRHVERVADSSGVAWDQWVFEDGSRAYFMKREGEEALLVSWR